MTTELHYPTTFTLLMIAFWAMPAQALPEDAEQPIQATYDNSLMLLDEGQQVINGSAETPAEIIQGTLKITGREITIERAEGEVKKITVIGNPARYQQQPAIDQQLAVAEANTIILDYDAQHLSLDGNVIFTQGSDQFSGCHIDYYLENRRLSTPLCGNGERARAILTPRNGQ